MYKKYNSTYTLCYYKQYISIRFRSLASLLLSTHPFLKRIIIAGFRWQGRPEHHQAEKSPNNE